MKKLTLKQIRVLNDLTQREFAEKYGMTPVTWQRIETGQTKAIKAELLLRICKDFNIDPRNVIL